MGLWFRWRSVRRFRAALQDFTAPLGRNGAASFHGQDDGEQDEQGADSGLGIGAPVGGAVQDNLDLVLDDDGQGRQGDNHHEAHGEEEHLVVPSGVAEPRGDSQEADAGEQLVGGAEEAPDLLEAVHAQQDAQDDRNQGRHIGIDHDFLPAFLNIFRRFPGLQEEFLEHETGQARRRIQGGQAERGVGQD